jgi:hypothetical protein
MTSGELNSAVKDIPMTDGIARLRINDEGFPVPWFVPWRDDKPIMNMADAEKYAAARRLNLCWCCGTNLGQYKAFVIGPMCAINRISSDPPSHRLCAEYAVRACPFLRNPRMRRNPNSPDHKVAPPGIMIERNPGVSLIWVTKTYRRLPEGLFELGDPSHLSYWREGRHATRDEILESVNSGLPILRKQAQEDGPAAMRQLEQMIERARQLIPEYSDEHNPTGNPSHPAEPAAAGVHHGDSG